MGMNYSHLIPFFSEDDPNEVVAANMPMLMLMMFPNENFAGHLFFSPIEFVSLICQSRDLI